MTAQSGAAGIAEPSEPSERTEPVTQGRLGRDFGLLWSASTLSSAGDGMSSVALPLLAAALTSDPALVGLTTSIGSLPWLLVGLVSGGDRRGGGRRGGGRRGDRPRMAMRTADGSGHFTITAVYVLLIPRES